MNATNKNPASACNTDGATVYPGRRPEYRPENRILSPTGRNAKGRFDDSPSLPACPR